MGVLSVVPHPRNRSGDPVKSLRTMQLNGTVAKEGYDPVEANSSGVAVEQKPAVARGDVVLQVEGRLCAVRGAAAWAPWLFGASASAAAAAALELGGSPSLCCWVSSANFHEI